MIRNNQGIPFCPEHYKMVLQADLSNQYALFSIEHRPSDRFKYLIARYFDECGQLEMFEQYDRIKLRIAKESQNGKRVREGLSFEIDVPFFPKNRQPSRIVTLIASFNITGYSFAFRRKSTPISVSA